MSLFHIVMQLMNLKNEVNMDKEERQYVNSVFEKDCWLDIVAKGSWERITIKNKSGDTIASFPIYKARYMGFKTLKIPPFTQTLGIYMEDTGAKLCKRLEREKKLINQIIEKIPPGYNCDFSLDINNQYILPFIWKGFKVQPRFSYRLEGLNDLEQIWKDFKENIKTDIRKAGKKVEIKKSKDLDVLIDMQNKTFARQNRKAPFNIEELKKLDDMLQKCNARELLYAVDESGNVHAATYFVYDENRCYYLMSGGDPNYRNSGATSLLVWEGIKHAAGRVNIFDFEGSMIEDIERFIRGFGAQSRVYYNVKKLNFILSFVEYMKPKIKKLIGYK